MFVANNFALGFVNGSRGRVVDFEYGKPVVELLSGKIIKVDEHSWSLNEDGHVRAEVSQLPLRLAWAITIHKSQGMSLDAAEIDLSRTFTSGMGYVALSRVRALDGLYLRGLNAMALTMHPNMDQFDADLRQQSTSLAAVTEDIADEVPRPAAVPSSNIDADLFDKLKRWRLERAKADGVAPFMVAHNTALTAIAGARPLTTRELMALPGFGPKKVDTYGADILTIVADHAT
jgi:hypothetical protein